MDRHFFLENDENFSFLTKTSVTFHYAWSQFAVVHAESFHKTARIHLVT